MVKKSAMRNVVKDVIIIIVGIVIIWLSIQAIFGTPNPFYVVASGSMIPVLEVYDVLVVQGRTPIEEVKVGDIIVFNRPSDHAKVIVHRVESIMSDDPVTLRAKGDANARSIPGTDFPITEDDYIGTVAYVVPQIGIVTQILKPPTNYIIIVIVVGIMIARQIFKKPNQPTTKQKSDLGFDRSPKESDTKPNSGFDSLSRKLSNLKKDSEYEDKDDKKL